MMGEPQDIQLYNVQWGWSTYYPPMDRFLAVNDPSADYRPSILGIPTWIPTEAAVTEAKQGGWLVRGVWRKKAERDDHAGAAAGFSHEEAEAFDLMLGAPGAAEMANALSRSNWLPKK